VTSTGWRRGGGGWRAARRRLAGARGDVDGGDVDGPAGGLAGWRAGGRAGALHSRPCWSAADHLCRACAGLGLPISQPITAGGVQHQLCRQAAVFGPVDLPRRSRPAASNISCAAAPPRLGPVDLPRRSRRGRPTSAVQTGRRVWAGRSPQAITAGGVQHQLCRQAAVSMPAHSHS
jgi:hypothetical protein